MDRFHIKAYISSVDGAELFVGRADSATAHHLVISHTFVHLVVILKEGQKTDLPFDVSRS